jgi:protein-L-isoaspartate(D-aspartate) O-methyltransferase
MVEFDARAMTIIRHAYARQMLAIAGVESDPALENAFATVLRERFLGDPPWRFSRAFGYEALPSSDPVLVYQDVLLALAPERGVNNGSPSLHAKWLHAVQPEPGERIVHIGAGAGYYSAIMAELVGASGHVTAVEFNPDLAAMAQERLADRANVTVLAGDGAHHPKEEADVVYVNFAVERPIRRWTDQLMPGGRLIFPLGVARPNRDPKTGRHSSHGAALLIKRQQQGLAVTWLGPAWFVCAEGQADATENEREALKAAFERGGVEFVKSLIWGEGNSPEKAWHAGDGWSLCYDPPHR